MGGNSFGDCFRVTTFGESHGKGVGVVIDGCLPGIKLNEDVIQEMLNKRRPDQSMATSTTREEKDRVVIYSGVFDGFTTGTPIMLMVLNEDADPGDYRAFSEMYRPGHADFTYQSKYGIRDWRGGGRASGRETLARVAAGAVAKAMLKPLELEVVAYTIAMGGVYTNDRDLEQIRQNRFLVPSKDDYLKMVSAVEQAREERDTIGGVVEILAQNVPLGLGEPVFDKLDAVLAQALMGIGAVKGVEIGAGFAAADIRGSQNNDIMIPEGFATNYAGGVLGGISTGQDLVMRVAVKPIPSVGLEQDTIDIRQQPQKLTIKGRHDVCAIPRINVVCESMVYLTLADFVLKQRAIT